MTVLARPLLTTHGAETIELLEFLEDKWGHDLWAEVEGRPDVQHWDCRRCGAVLERRFEDGAVGGSALHTQCPGVRPRRMNG